MATEGETVRATKKMPPDRMLGRDLKSSTARREYDRASSAIRDFDDIVRRIETVREQRGLSKKDIAKAAGLSPSLVRRLLTAPDLNPSWSTVQAIAYAVGLRLTLELVPASETRTPLRDYAHAP
jgi:ribosome-binding protein aMBF1 (putative translation factor)